MKFNIKYKLLLAMLSAHVMVVAAMYGILRYNFEKGLLEYVSRVDECYVPAVLSGLEEYYDQFNSWEVLQYNEEQWFEILGSSINPIPPEFNSDILNDRPPSGTDCYGPRNWLFQQEYSAAAPRILVLDAEERLIQGDPRAIPFASFQGIESRGEIVGYLGVARRQELSSEQDQFFSAQQNQSFLYHALFGIAISVLIAFPLSTAMVRPIKELVAGTRALTSGNYSSRIKSRTGDEIGLLSRDFNTLAKTLEQNQQARQQWIADISHELRTPLAVLRGELESIQDGIRPMTPEALDSLHHEVVHLNALVNDLHELSLSDMGALVYEKETIDLGNLVERNLDMYESSLEKQSISATINLHPLVADRPIYIDGDEKRLSQLFSNMLQNSSRYTEEAGKLQIDIKESASEITVIISDSGPGVSDKDLPKLFDRLYRVENSRNRTQGGSGLGLAICKNIVEAHDGTIEASHSPLGGLKITITLPVNSR